MGETKHINWSLRNNSKKNAKLNIILNMLSLHFKEWRCTIHWMQAQYLIIWNPNLKNKIKLCNKNNEEILENSVKIYQKYFLLSKLLLPLRRLKIPLASTLWKIARSNSTITTFILVSENFQKLQISSRSERNNIT